jgi:hypothetical protein
MAVFRLQVHLGLSGFQQALDGIVSVEGSDADFVVTGHVV